MIKLCVYSSLTTVWRMTWNTISGSREGGQGAVAMVQEKDGGHKEPGNWGEGWGKGKRYFEDRINMLSE